jgi:hypothetical protein
MMQAEMASNPAQVHPIHVQLDRFAAHFFWVSPGFGLWGVFDLAEHAAIALAATARFPSSVLPFCSLTFWTFNHTYILAHFLATPSLWQFQESLTGRQKDPSR